MPILRHLFFILLATACVALAACGESSPAEPSPGEQSSDDTNSGDTAGDTGADTESIDGSSGSDSSSDDSSGDTPTDSGDGDEQEEPTSTLSDCESFCSESIRTAIGACLVESEEGPVDYAECLEICEEDGFGVLTDCMNQAGSNCEEVESCFEEMDGEGGPDDEGDAGSELPPTLSQFEIAPLTTGSLSSYFSKYTTVFGVYIVATEGTPDAKVLHAANIMAEYLDNDEDEVVDDQAVVDVLVSKNATLMMFATENEVESSGVFESSAIDNLAGQDLYATETAPAGGFDAALEEVLHLISSHGYEAVYPSALSSQPTSLLTEAMDLARGGHFTSIPSSYPASAWYHYDDYTCDYRCMAVEYFYWALTTKLGAQSGRCNEIDHEWELCTPSQLQSGDTAIYEILANPQYRLPTVLPDGNYRGSMP